MALLGETVVLDFVGDDLVKLRRGNLLEAVRRVCHKSDALGLDFRPSLSHKIKYMQPEFAYIA